MLKPWLDFTLNAAFLGLETQRVVGLRLMKLAAGGTAAQTEAQLMVTEKVAAFAEAAVTLAAGGSAHGVLRRYRTHVQANERRLTRRKR
ncbi:MAG TPA: hypothetical protein VHL98_20035 [Microvirga sp.]|jgi:hypothetical protein|nr:hypothetical protein [Microvirga sp.]